MTKLEGPRPIRPWDALKKDDQTGISLGGFLGSMMVGAAVLVVATGPTSEENDAWILAGLLLFLGLGGILVLAAAAWSARKLWRWRQMLQAPGQWPGPQRATITEHVWVYAKDNAVVTSDTITGHIRWRDSEGGIGTSKRAYPRNIVEAHPIGMEIEVRTLGPTEEETESFWCAELPKP